MGDCLTISHICIALPAVKWVSYCVSGAIEADGAWVVSQVWPKVYAPTKGVWYFG